MTQEQRVRLLLEAWFDYFPYPETWTGELQRRAVEHGPAPFRTVECDDCEGRGRNRSGWLCRSCRGRGRYAIDDYTGEPVDTAATPFRELLARAVNCPTCGGWGRLGADSNTRPERHHRLCDECEGTGKVPAPFTGPFRPFRDQAEDRERIGDARLDGMNRQHEARDQYDAYQLLDVAMSKLHALRPSGHFLVSWVYVLGMQSSRSLLPSMHHELVRAIDFLVAELPEGLRLPAEVVAGERHREAALVRAKGCSADRKAQAARDREIRRLAGEGVAQSELAVRFSIDKSRVSRIVARPE